jgi:negative regulator of flagellin synthesis FlgM
VLSDAASALLSASGAVSGDFDAAKVERIGKAIAEGSFKANPEAIADKLIANTQELLRKHSH